MNNSRWSFVQSFVQASAALALLLAGCAPVAPVETPEPSAPARLTVSMPPTVWTPIEWQRDGGKLRNWVRDADGNYVDDLIDALPADEYVSITVDLNRCINEDADLSFLHQYGNVDFAGQHLSFVLMNEVRVDRAVALAQLPEVAGVELNVSGEWTSDDFKAAKVENSTVYGTATLQGAFGWPQTLKGQGVNIALLDSGVGSAYDARFVHGYDAVRDVEGNPDADPQADHGTAMASWIWSTGGMAPGAGLIDIRADCAPPENPDDPDEVDASYRLCYASLMKGLEKIRQRQLDWNIHVVNMSVGIHGPQDDMSALANLVNLLSDSGVVMVASAGGNYKDAPVHLPGGAARAIAVGAADIMDTVDRANDTATQVKGPWPGVDPAALSAHKPEVMMPTLALTIPTGEKFVSSSIASAMTSGLVALILQQNPDWRNPDNKAAGLVKDLLIRSAEAKGSSTTALAYPSSSPTWNPYWGFGEIDAYAAFTQLTSNMRTDLTFAGFDGSAHPSQPWYFSRAVETESQRNNDNPTAGKPDKIYARIVNKGAQDAHNVPVSFLFHPIDAGIPKFHDIGTVIVPTIRAHETVDVVMPWTPSELLPGQDHGCIIVNIDYNLDTNVAGQSNFAQRNVQIKTASSPAVFTFGLANPLPFAAQIDLEVVADPATAADLATWRVEMNDVSSAPPGRCGRQIEVTVTPPEGTPSGTEAIFFVNAVASGEGESGEGVDEKEIGGVALKVIVP
jgi:hypothetical protein